jgi:hypothetical protein
MITLRRADERRCDRRGKQEVWLTFDATGDSETMDGPGFGSLEILNEHHLPPGATALRYPHGDAEVIIYVREGAIAYQDSFGRAGVVHSGEFQRLTADRSIRHTETNASRTEWAHVFQMRLQPRQSGLAASRERKYFSVADRRGGLRVVASPDARRGSLSIRQDAMIYSSLLDPGQHVVHELAAGHRAWLHLVHGRVTLAELVLTTGDGVGVTAERAVSITARDASEVLLLDLAAGASLARAH